MNYLNDIIKLGPKKYERELKSLLDKIRNLDQMQEQKFQRLIITILFSQKAYFRQASQNQANEVRNESSHWKKRVDVEKKFAVLCQNYLVRPFSSRIEFYELDELECHHKRRRRDCEMLHERLWFFIELQRSKYVESPIWTILKEIYLEFRNMKVDPLEIDKTSFCDPFANNKATKKIFFPPTASSGRPKKLELNFFIQHTVDQLKNLGLPLIESCKYASEILLYCFDETLDAESLSRQFRRLKKNP